jgi:hypothetical protein
MGMYLVSIDADEWTGGPDGADPADTADTADTADESPWPRAATALDEELVRRGLPRYDSVPPAAEFVRGSGQSFEEKLVPSMDGFAKLCEEVLSWDGMAAVLGWTLLVPLSLDEQITLPVPSAYADETVVAGAPQLLAMAERLAAAVELPPEVPRMCDNLDLTTWFLDGEARRLAAVRPGRWSEDLDTAFYVALMLRAAQHSLRRGCPVAYC